MRDVVYPVQKATLIALSGITYNSVGVPAYFKELPDDLTAENYIIFDVVINTDASTFQSAETLTLHRITIHTFQAKYNTGKAVAAIANEVFDRIYPNSQARLDLSPDNMRCVWTELDNDIPQDYRLLNSKVYLDRIIIFRHKIYHG